MLEDCYRDWNAKTDFQIYNGVFTKMFKRDTTLAWDKKPDPFSTKMIENQIKGFQYQLLFNKVRRMEDERVEFGNLPFFVDMFYFYVYMRGHVPSPEDFIRWYILLNFKRKDSCIVVYNGREYPLDSVGKRALNGYASLIRDFHFYYLCKECGRFEDVKYSLVDDKNGKDVIVQYNGDKYFVHLFVKTRRSSDFRDIKNWRHTFVGNHIDVPIDFRDCNVCGDFFLYSGQDAYELSKKIQQMSAGSNNCQRAAA